MNSSVSIIVSCAAESDFHSRHLRRHPWDRITLTHWCREPAPLGLIVPTKSEVTFFFALAETRLRGQVSNRGLKSTNTATRKPVQKEGWDAYNPLPTYFPPMATGCWAALKFVQGQSGTRYNPPARPVQLQLRSGRNILPTPPYHRPKHPHT